MPSNIMNQWGHCTVVHYCTVLQYSTVRVECFTPISNQHQWLLFSSECDRLHHSLALSSSLLSVYASSIRLRVNTVDLTYPIGRHGMACVHRINCYAQSDWIVTVRVIRSEICWCGTWTKRWCCIQWCGLQRCTALHCLQEFIRIISRFSSVALPYPLRVFFSPNKLK